MALEDAINNRAESKMYQDQVQQIAQDYEQYREKDQSVLESVNL